MIETPDWFTTGRTILSMKDTEKRDYTNKIRPISCLPFLRRIFTGIINE